MTQPPAPPTAEWDGPSPDLEASRPRRGSWRGRVAAVASWQYLVVVAATLVFGATCIGFLVVTPTLVSPDEEYHFDRVIAAEHGHIVLAPEAINVSRGARGVEHTYVATYMHGGGKSWADFKPVPRADRPSVDALGGDQRSPNRDVSNYETQHPPLYYAIMGGLTRLWPGADAMAGDKLVLLIRTFNVLLMLPLPLLFFAAARRLIDNDAIAKSAAFLPLLLPGVAKCAATINNDNLAILFGSIIVFLAVRVMTGDRTVRTAALISAACVGASLTKATVLFVLWIVLAAYIVNWVRARSWPGWQVFGTLAIGGVLTASWWAHNYIAYGKVQPDAWGSQFALAQGRPRGDIPIDMHAFYRTLWVTAPSRFWGALGLLEPPKLPHAMIVGLTIALFVCCIAAVLILRGRRWDLVILIAAPASAQAMVVLQAYLHYRHYLSIPGIQGRYVYPTVFGVLLPFSIVLVWLLRRWAQWAPLVMCVIGLVISVWAIYVQAEFTWLHRGERLVPGNWRRAYDTLSAFFPLRSPAVLVFIALCAVLCISALTLTAVTVRRQPVPIAAGGDPERSEPGSPIHSASDR